VSAPLIIALGLAAYVIVVVGILGILGTAARADAAMQAALDAESEGP